jgi:hypothetical protein
VTVFRSLSSTLTFPLGNDWDRAPQRIPDPILPCLVLS